MDKLSSLKKYKLKFALVIIHIWPILIFHKLAECQLAKCFCHVSVLSDENIVCV